MQAISELESVKNSLRQPFLAKQMVAASLQRLEDGFRKQSQVLQILTVRAMANCAWVADQCCITNCGKSSSCNKDVTVICIYVDCMAA